MSGVKACWAQVVCAGVQGIVEVEAAAVESKLKVNGNGWSKVLVLVNNCKARFQIQSNIVLLLDSLLVRHKTQLRVANSPLIDTTPMSYEATERLLSSRESNKSGIEKLPIKFLSQWCALHAIPVVPMGKRASTAIKCDYVQAIWKFVHHVNLGRQPCNEITHVVAVDILVAEK